MSSFLVVGDSDDYGLTFPPGAGSWFWACPPYHHSWGSSAAAAAVDVPLDGPIVTGVADHDTPVSGRWLGLDGL